MDPRTGLDTYEEKNLAAAGIRSPDYSDRSASSSHPTPSYSAAVSKAQSLTSFPLRGGVVNAVMHRHFDLRGGIAKINLQLFVYSGSETKFSVFECYNWFTQGINRMGV